MNEHNTVVDTKILREKTVPIAPLSTTDPKLTGLGVNLGVCSVTVTV
jgi:hypothetical protein